MPLVDIELIEGVFDEDQKQRMIRDVTETMPTTEMKEQTCPRSSTKT